MQLLDDAGEAAVKAEVGAEAKATADGMKVNGDGLFHGTKRDVIETRLRLFHHPRSASPSVRSVTRVIQAGRR